MPLTTINFDHKEVRLIKAILHDEADRLDQLMRKYRQGTESQKRTEEARDNVLRLLKTFKMMELTE